MITYKIVEARTIDALSIQVSKEMGNGWIPCGSLVVVDGGHGIIKYLQPIMKMDI